MYLASSHAFEPEATHARSHFSARLRDVCAAAMLKQASPTSPLKLSSISFSHSLASASMESNKRTANEQQVNWGPRGEWMMSRFKPRALCVDTVGEALFPCLYIHISWARETGRGREAPEREREKEKRRSNASEK